jgi:hypothetical protein
MRMVNLCEIAFAFCLLWLGRANTKLQVYYSSTSDTVVASCVFLRMSVYDHTRSIKKILNHRVKYVRNKIF